MDEIDEEEEAKENSERGAGGLRIVGGTGGVEH